MRERLPMLAKRYGIETVADVGCGDQWWVRKVEWEVEYEGFDIEHQPVKFNCIVDVLPKAYDLIMCLYVTNHMTTWKYIQQTIENFQKSGSKYLLLTYADGPKDREPWHCPIEWPPLELFLANDNPKWKWWHGLWELKP